MRYLLQIINYAMLDNAFKSVSNFSKDQTWQQIETFLKERK